MAFRQRPGNSLLTHYDNLALCIHHHASSTDGFLWFFNNFPICFVANDTDVILASVDSKSAARTADEVSPGIPINFTAAFFASIVCFHALFFLNSLFCQHNREKVSKIHNFHDYRRVFLISIANLGFHPSTRTFGSVRDFALLHSFILSFISIAKCVFHILPVADMTMSAPRERYS